MGSTDSAMLNDFVINCSETRYHVVRTAAVSLGWTIEDGARTEPVPRCFHGIDIESRTLHTKSTVDAVGSALHRRGLYDPATSPQVVWVDKSIIGARLQRLGPYQRVNHFPGMNCIARKAVLFQRLMRIRRLAERKLMVRKPAVTAQGTRGSKAVEAPVPEETEAAAVTVSLRDTMDIFYPQSFSSITDGGALYEYVSHRSTTRLEGTSSFFIVKPNRGTEGRGIRLTRDPLSVLTSAETHDPASECLIQTYVDRPLLIDGKKFDLRLYVLLTSLAAPRRVRSPAVAKGTSSSSAPSLAEEQTTAGATLPAILAGIRLYVHSEGLVRVCALPYAAPTDENQSSPGVHITNYAVNKQQEGFHVEALAPVKDDDHEVIPHGVDTGNKRDLAFLARYINELSRTNSEGSHNWQSVWRRISECLTLTVLSGTGRLRREWAGAMGSRAARGDCHSSFELLGFDIMLHADTFAPVLMEVNHSPSLFCETSFDFAVKQQVMRDVLRLVTSGVEVSKGKAMTGVAHPRVSQMDAEAALAKQAKVGFHQLLPHYLPCGGGSGDHITDWTPDERARQVRMVELGDELL